MNLTKLFALFTASIAAAGAPSAEYSQISRQDYKYGRFKTMAVSCIPLKS